ncbi:MAG: hypothetical protein WC100_05825 [Sterolibacterium sp.]
MLNNWINAEEVIAAKNYSGTRAEGIRAEINGAKKYAIDCMEILTMRLASADADSAASLIEEARRIMAHIENHSTK